MKLRALHVKNFRSYNQEIVIDFDDLTAIIGKNDIGKSTLLEALSIFFKDGTISIEHNDLNIHAKSTENYNIEIACVFSDLPKELIIDTSSITSLKQEHLSYIEDEIEYLKVIKVYDASKKTPKETTFINALRYPIKDKVNDLHTLKRSQLSTRAKDLGIDLSDVDERNSTELRNAIWNQLDLKESDFGEAFVSADNDEYGKKIWTSLSAYLPFFALFQSDRASKDGDSEVQDPIKVAIGQAVKKVEQKLIQIEQDVENEVAETLKRTSEKMKEIAPGWEDDEELIPLPAKNINWATSFKYQLLGNDDIPINKRGSGMRRLILLAFFQAEAERRMKESNSQNVIYAIEEPETSQHPNHQIQLLESFQSLSNQDKTQIIITTHVPSLARKLDSSQIRYLFTNDVLEKEIDKGEDVLKKVADSLGVLPDPNNTVEVIILVEGKHDVAFLKRISEILNEEDEDSINLNDDNRFIIIPVGGSTLKDFINLKYLQSLNKKEFHLYDSDDPSYRDEVRKVNEREGDDYAIQTLRREIENYIPSILFREVYANRGIDIELVEFGGADDVPDIVSKHVFEARHQDQTWEGYTGNKKNYHRGVKRTVENDILGLLTIGHFIELDVVDEFKEWFDQLNNMLE